ncbi:MAG: hypothetical protein VB144_11780 [Clostridia bacterium]|nr:hypothetical protein [Clostridia bacterium]
MEIRYKPFTVHITSQRSCVRRYVCRRATEEQAIHAADKLLKGAPGAVVEIYRDRGSRDMELVSVLGGYQRAS